MERVGHAATAATINNNTERRTIIQAPQFGERLVLKTPVAIIFDQRASSGKGIGYATFHHARGSLWGQSDLRLLSRRRRCPSGGARQHPEGIARR
jgi:hypothetical protein